MRIDVETESTMSLGVIAEKLHRGVENGVKKGTGIMTNAAKRDAPYRYGTLRRSIMGSTENDGLSFIGTVRQDDKVASYGKYVEFGTGIYGPEHRKIVPKSKKALAWMIGRAGRPSSAAGWRDAVKSGRGVVVRSTKGMKAQPYMKPAYEHNKEKVKRVVAEEIFAEFKR